MSSKRNAPRGSRAYLQDIVDSAQHIENFVAGMSYTDYLEDRKTSSAVERMFLIISEAAIRLGPLAEQLCPSQDWNAIRGFGNVIRHEYSALEDEIIWEAIRTKLPLLKQDVAQSLQTN